MNVASVSYSALYPLGLVHTKKHSMSADNIPSICIHFSLRFFWNVSQKSTDFLNSTTKKYAHYFFQKLQQNYRERTKITATKFAHTTLSSTLSLLYLFQQMINIAPYI